MKSEIYNAFKKFLLTIDTTHWELKSCNQQEIFMQKKGDIGELHHQMVK